MKTRTQLLPLAIAAAIGLGACSQDSGNDTAAATASTIAPTIHSDCHHPRLCFALTGHTPRLVIAM